MERVLRLKTKKITFLPMSQLLPSAISAIKAIINRSLDRSEEMWNSTMGKVAFSHRLDEETETNIPGHPYLKDNEYKSDEFIAMMVDMRDSTKHLRQAISARIASVSEMKRVFFEVSALLPAVAKVIRDEDGAVTEYLGDGALALFQLPKEKSPREKAIYSATRASQKCLHALKECINPILFERYGLPPIQIGIGLAFSDAIITKFGLRPETQVKVIGECVYFASNLSKGRNEIFVHEWLENMWPTGEKGMIRFSKKSKFADVDGFLLEENQS